MICVNIPGWEKTKAEVVGCQGPAHTMRPHTPHPRQAIAHRCNPRDAPVKLIVKEKTKMNTDYLNFCPRLKKMIDTGTSINSKGEKIQIAGTSTLNNIRIIREIL